MFDVEEVGDRGAKLLCDSCQLCLLTDGEILALTRGSHIAEDWFEFNRAKSQGSSLVASEAGMSVRIFILSRSDI